VRCYLLRNTTSGGQLVAQSADATCHGGLQSPTDGYLSFNMTAAETRQAHAFTISSENLQRLIFAILGGPMRTSTGIAEPHQFAY
jgi:hypothetical protein